MSFCIIPVNESTVSHVPNLNHSLFYWRINNWLVKYQNLSSDGDKGLQDELPSSLVHGDHVRL